MAEDASPRRGRMGSLWPGLRQRRYPPAFRIAPPTWPVGLRADLERIAELLGHEAGPVTAAPDTAAPATPTAPIWDDDAVVEAAMGLWRAGRRVEFEDPAGDSQVMRQLRRHVRSGSAGLAALGVQVIVHDDERFDPGMSVEVLATQPVAGLTRATIIETVRPTIYLGDRWIQRAQVIVGSPDGPAE